VLQHVCFAPALAGNIYLEGYPGIELGWGRAALSMDGQDAPGLFQVVHARLLVQASAQLHQPAWLCQAQAQQAPAHHLVTLFLEQTILVSSLSWKHEQLHSKHNCAVCGG